MFDFRIFILDRETDIYRETDRIRKQIVVERKIQDDLRNETVQLKCQLEESKQGLLAASRLTDQLENAKQQVNGLKQEGTYFVGWKQWHGNLVNSLAFFQAWFELEFVVDSLYVLY